MKSDQMGYIDKIDFTTKTSKELSTNSYGLAFSLVEQPCKPWLQKLGNYWYGIS
jgi:hypothetical protein